MRPHILPSFYVVDELRSSGSAGLMESSNSSFASNRRRNDVGDQGGRSERAAVVELGRESVTLPRRFFL